LHSTHYEPVISKVLTPLRYQVRHVLTRDYTVLPATHTFIQSGIGLPLLPGHRTSLHFGWYSFPIPLRAWGWVDLAGLVKYWGGLSGQRWLSIPTAVGNRTRGHWVARPIA